MKTKTVWLVPLLWAMFWGSCADDGVTKALSQKERDIRFAMSAFASSMAAALILREILKHD